MNDMTKKTSPNQATPTETAATLFKIMLAKPIGLVKSGYERVSDKFKAALTREVPEESDGVIRLRNIEAALGASLLFFLGLSLFVAGSLAFISWFATLGLFVSWLATAFGFVSYAMISYFELRQSPFEHGANSDPVRTLSWLAIVLIDLGVNFDGTLRWLVGKTIMFGGLNRTFGAEGKVTPIVAFGLAIIIAFLAEPLLKSGLRNMLAAFYIRFEWLEPKRKGQIQDKKGGW